MSVYSFLNCILTIREFTFCQGSLKRGLGVSMVTFLHIAALRIDHIKICSLNMDQGKVNLEIVNWKLEIIFKNFFQQFGICLRIPIYSLFYYAFST